MARGKKGPIPEDLNEPTDPTAEQIVGEENVVDVGEVDPPPGMRCAECTFTSNLLSEMEEHCAGTGHGGSRPEPQQPALFSEKGVVTRSIEVPLEPEFLAAKRERLAELYQEALDVKAKKKSADSAFNAELSDLDEQMQEIARVLRRPYTYEHVDCEWRIIDGENARGLYRLDTGEQVDKQPLSEEDRLEELARAEKQNEQAVGA